MRRQSLRNTVREIFRETFNELFLVDEDFTDISSDEELIVLTEYTTKLFKYTAKKNSAIRITAASYRFLDLGCADT